MGRLDGKVCVITGAGGRVGREAAVLFAREGAELCVADLDGDAAQRTAAACGGGGGAIAIRVDVTDEASVAALYEAAAAVFGGIDVLFNNAGVKPPPGLGAELSVVEPSTEVWRHVQAVNAAGTYLCCNEGIPHLLRRGGGSVINGTASYLVGGDDDSSAAARGSVLAFSRSLARRFAGHGIRVNALCPGPVRDLPSPIGDTGEPSASDERRLPMRRFAAPREIAFAALFLASEESSYVTGATLVVDGGLGVSTA
jgi:NAD(P)-dependent dehydrogenase (short-subunit alcohol dehydrogenase family)